MWQIFYSHSLIWELEQYLESLADGVAKIRKGVNSVSVSAFSRDRLLNWEPKDSPSPVVQHNLFIAVLM
jgi:hypothetical protein